jgi:hypothetical protein
MSLPMGAVDCSSHAKYRALLTRAGRNADGQLRLLWILNHKTLLPAEVPILRSLGFAVFIPKRVPGTPEHKSSIVDYSYDAELGIPYEALAVLNSHKFYEEHWSETIAAILNRYFDIVTTSVYTVPLFETVRTFRGCVFLRAFGREKPARYTTFFENGTHPSMLEQIEAMGSRFVFAQGFDNLGHIEDIRLARRARTIGVTLPDSIWHRRDTWLGGRPEILLHCPLIHSAYYAPHYAELKEVFSDMQHVIFGPQVTSVEDPAVLPYLSDDDLLKLYADASVFAYLSVEPRHLHYSPIEAMIVGTPVLYRSGGMLDHLAAQPLPGCCGDIGEMREKARRLQMGDRELATMIRHSQAHIVATFSTSIAIRQWADVLSEVSCPSIPAENS